MLKQRRARVRQICATEAYALKRKAHAYRLKQYTYLLKLGVPEAIADRAFDIWENGCVTKADCDVLDKLAQFLEKRLQPAVLARFPLAS